MNPLQQKAKAGVITAAYLNFRISEGKKETNGTLGVNTVTRRTFVTKAENF